MANILYLEDEQWQVQGTVITFIERELGHAVSHVQSVANAETALMTDRYDVVFLDVMMDPHQGLIEFENSGLQIAQFILAGKYTAAGNPPTIPIVIASGVLDATVEDATGARSTVEGRALALGISERGFLRKPFLVDEIRDVLEWALEQGGR